MKPVRQVFAAVKSRYLHDRSMYYFVSFPKSGRTWSKSVLANYYSLVHGVPLFHDFAPLVRTGGRRSVPRILFTHANHLGADASAAGVIRSLSSKRVVLLVRDPAETTHTFYYRLLKRKRHPEVQNLSLEEFVQHPTLGLPQVVRFLNRWYESRDTFSAFLLLRYDACVRDPHGSFTSLLHFLGEVDVDSKALDLAIRRSFDSTRRIEEGGVDVDQRVLDDKAAGDAIYFGRESASQLERSAGSGATLSTCIGPQSHRFVQETLSALDPDLQFPIDQTEGMSP